MSTWCLNDVTITHDNPKIIERFVQGFNSEALFGEFIPIPRNLPVPAPFDVSSHQHATDYVQRWDRHLHEEAMCWEKLVNWCMRNWGTKWDTGKGEGATMEVTYPNRIRLIFTTESHPISILDHWVDIGCQVYAEFSEIKRYRRRHVREQN